MINYPTLQTSRLVLRTFTWADAADIQRLAGDRDIAATTITIPHPYEDGVAEQWINRNQESFMKGEVVVFAIVLRLKECLIGAIDLHINQQHVNAEMGYWIGKPYWNQGYCTEAAKAVLRHAFEVLGLNRIYATHFKRNPASGRVLQKIGMSYEGCLKHVMKWGVFEDLEQYGILRRDFISKK